MKGIPEMIGAILGVSLAVLVLYLSGASLDNIISSVIFGSVLGTIAILLCRRKRA